MTGCICVKLKAHSDIETIHKVDFLPQLGYSCVRWGIGTQLNILMGIGIIHAAFDGILRPAVRLVLDMKQAGLAIMEKVEIYGNPKLRISGRA